MTSDYSARATQYQTKRDGERARSRLISRSRLGVFLVAALCFLRAMMAGAHPWALGAGGGLLLIFVALVIWHSRVDDRARWYDALCVVNLRARARVERRWQDLPPAPPPTGIDLTNHPYALDLDLFGRASLYQWLGPPGTAAGATRLAEWILTAAEPDIVRARQVAVAELAPLDDWRERLAAHGLRARGGGQRAVDMFAEWVDDEPVTGRLFHWLVYTLTAINLFVLGALLLGAIDPRVAVLAGAPALVLSLIMARKTHRIFDRAGSGESTLARYADLLEHVTARPFQSHSASRGGRTAHQRRPPGPGLDANAQSPARLRRPQT